MLTRQDGSTAWYRAPRRAVDDVCVVQDLDPNAPVAHVGITHRSFRFPRPHLLEAQVVSCKPHVPRGLHRHGSLLDLGRHRLYRQQHRIAGGHIHSGHLRGAELVRMPDKIRLYQLDAVSVRCAVGVDLVWLHVGLLSQDIDHGAWVRSGGSADLLWVHPGGYTAHHAPLPCGGGDCGCHLALPGHH